MQDGFLRTLLGDPNQATVRAGYSEAYERQGLTRFTDLYGGNRGASISLTRDANTGLVPPGQSWPVLLSQKDRLSTATFNPDPTYPILVRANRADSVNAFAPDIEIARVRNWMVGFARSISKDMAVEIRYVGNRGDNEWQSLNYNCLTSNNSGCTAIRGENLVANGFMDEFKLAMRNLAANNASGSRAAPDRSPTSARAPAPARCPSIWHTEWQPRRRQSGGLYQRREHLGECHHRRPPRRTEPEPERGGGRSRRQPHAPQPGAGARLRANFFIVNPDVANANVTDSGQFSKYNALQLELRRRLSNGFSANVNYQYAFEGGSQFDGFTFGRAWTDIPVTGNPTVRHAIKMQADWTLPFGRGERFGTDMHPASTRWPAAGASPASAACRRS